jgi:peptidoglycan/xylan/chitin deacetylase (PgdA/CDA1 family)
MRTASRRFRIALMALGIAAISPPAQAKTVALTFDDLPVFGKFSTAEDGAAVTDRLLAGLARHHWKATGFVNEIQLDTADRPRRIALLQHWLDAGMDLGNHTYSHHSLSVTPVDEYIADVAHGETATAPLLAALGRRERWFRYPYLETGLTVATRKRFEGWLAEHRYRVAPVTMENSDWQFSAPYDDAVARGDAAEAARIQRRYLTFTRKVVAWYQKAGRTLFRREPAFVFLLHASRLNAASIDGLATILKAASLHVVPLDTAMRDPAYRTADSYVGPNGIEWLERWSLTLHRDLPFDSLPEVPQDIIEADERLESVTDPHAVEMVVPGHP